MTNIKTRLDALRRPRLLVRAARLGVADFNRDRDLARLVGGMRAPTPERAVQQLMEHETQIEETRRAGDAAYSVSRHVEILIALMAEARLLPRADAA